MTKTVSLYLQAPRYERPQDTPDQCIAKMLLMQQGDCYMCYRFAPCAARCSPYSTLMYHLGNSPGQCDEVQIPTI